MNSNKSILLVDDQENIRSDLKLWLEKAHFQVHTAATIEEAKQIIASSKLDIAIVDLNLDYRSQYSGIDVVNQFKQHHPMSKIIILSAYSLSDDIEPLIAGKYDAFVSKGGSQNYIRALLMEIKAFQDE